MHYCLQLKSGKFEWISNLYLEFIIIFDLFAATVSCSVDIHVGSLASNLQIIQSANPFICKYICRSW